MNITSITKIDEKHIAILDLSTFPTQFEYRRVLFFTQILPKKHRVFNDN